MDFIVAPKATFLPVTTEFEEYEEGELLEQEVKSSQFKEESPLLRSEILASGIINRRLSKEGIHFPPVLNCSHGAQSNQITGYLRTPRLVNRKKKRVVFSSSNVGLVPFIVNLFHTFVSSSWGVIFLIFFCIYIFSFSFWGFMYWGLDSFYSKSCVANLHSYSDALFFALQTQMTIGYGYMYPENNGCAAVVVALMLHSLSSLLLDTVILGVVYTRFSRPRMRAQTIILSDKAVITTNHRGERFFTFRLANLRKTQLINTQIRLILHRCVKTTDAGTMVDFQDLKLKEANTPFLALPVLVSHQLNETSAIREISDSFLSYADPELIVVVEGIDANTSAIIQALFSYKAEDIVFDHHFNQMIQINVDKEDSLRYFVDFGEFNSISPD